MQEIINAPNGAPSVDSISNPYDGLHAHHGIGAESKNALDLAGAEFDASLALADYQNQWNYAMEMDKRAYETPKARADRMRAAGLNPDLMGLGDSTAGAPSAAGFNPTHADLQGARANDIAKMQYATQTALQVAGTVMQGIQSYKGIQMTNGQLGMLNTQLGNTDYNAVVQYYQNHPDTLQDFVVTNADGSTYLDESKIVSSQDISSLYEQVMHTPWNKATKSQQDIFKKNLVQAQRDMATQIGQNRNQSLLNTSEVDQRVTAEVRQQANDEVIHNMVQQSIKNKDLQMKTQFQINKYQDEYYKMLDPDTAAKVINCRNGNDLQYLMTVDPELAALNENDRQKLVRTQQKIQEAQMSVYEAMYNNLVEQYNKFKQGNSWKDKALTFGYGAAILSAGTLSPQNGGITGPVANVTQAAMKALF